MKILGLLTLMAIAYYLYSLDERLRLNNKLIRDLDLRVGCYND